MRFTDLITAIGAHADVSESDAQTIAKGLIERGLIKGDILAEPKACECYTARLSEVSTSAVG